MPFIQVVYDHFIMSTHIVFIVFMPVSVFLGEENVYQNLQTFLSAIVWDLMRPSMIITNRQNSQSLETRDR